MQQLGNYMKNLRLKKKMSMVEAGKKGGLCKSYIAKLERGETIPKVETIVLLAQAYNIPSIRIFTQVAQAVNRNWHT